MAYGTYDAYLGVAKQSVKGTAVAPTTFIKYRDKDINPVFDSEFYYEAGGGRKQKYAVKTLSKHDGSLMFLARPKACGILLHALLGADAVSGVGPYDHVLTPADTLPWLTVETGEVKTSSLIIERIADCMFNSAKISGRAGRPVEISMDFMGIEAAVQATAASPSYESDDPFVFYQGTFTVDSGATTYITEFDISINNNIPGDIQTTDFVRDDMLALGLEITVDFKLKLTDATQYKAIHYGGATAPVEALDEGDFTVALAYGAGVAERGLTIAIPKLYYTAAELPRGADPDVMYLSCHGKAVEGASSIITATVKNDVATDYDT